MHMYSGKLFVAHLYSKFLLPISGLLGYGIQSDDSGGDVQFVSISALKGDGIDKLLEAIVLQAEILNIKASFEVHSSRTPIS